MPNEGCALKTHFMELAPRKASYHSPAGQRGRYITQNVMGSHYRGGAGRPVECCCQHGPAF